MAGVPPQQGAPHEEPAGDFECRRAAALRAAGAFRPRKWAGSGRVGRKSWAEARAVRGLAAPPSSVHDFATAVVSYSLGEPEPGLQPAPRDAAAPVKTPPEGEVEAALPESFRRVESEREAIERRHASHRLAEALVAKFGGADGAATPMELVAEKMAQVARLEAELTALRAEKHSLEDALEMAESRLSEETKRAERAEAEAAELREARSEASPASGAARAAPGEAAAQATTAAPAAAPLGAIQSPLSGASPREHVEAIRQERLHGFQSPALRDMFIGCVELLAADIYASQAHFVLELLQNADDNEFRCGGGQVPTARFAVHSGEQAYVVVANNEVGLSPQDVVGMCAISKSSKAGKTDRTGRKGIGFKSVFAVSACPHILSGAYTFKFDVTEDRMGYVTPTWLDEEQLATVPPEVRAMHAEGLTCIYLPLGAGAARAGLIQEVEAHLEALDPATLLFLRRLRRVEFRRQDGCRTVLEYDGDARPGGGIAREAVAVSAAPTDDGAAPGEATRDLHEFFVCRGIAEDGKRGPVAVALPAIREGAAPPPQRAFATLPLCHTGLAAAVNADWDVSASRDGVHENHRNERLVLEAAKAFVLASQHLGAELPGFSPLDYLGDRAPLQRFWRRARERFLQELVAGDVPCIPVEAEEGEEGAPTLVTASQAVRRPGSGASASERSAAGLVGAGLLRRGTGCRFAREPLPAGVEIETFGLGHYAKCLPLLVEEAMAADEAARSGRLAQLYAALLDLLQDASSGAMELPERVALVRSAPAFPVLLQGGGAAPAALADGPIFLSSALEGESAEAARAFSPPGAEEVSAPGRLRVLAAEVREAVPSAMCSRLLGLRPCAAREHLWGLCAELHMSEEGALRGAADPAHLWASLDLLRCDLQQGRAAAAAAAVEVEAAEEADPLVDQGRLLLQAAAERRATALFVPVADGSLRQGGSLRCPLALGLPLSEHEAGQAETVDGPAFAALPPAILRSEDSSLKTSWEHFFSRAMRMASGVAELASPARKAGAQRLSRQLLSYEWWLSLAADPAQRGAAEDYVREFVREHAAVLSALPAPAEAGAWSLGEFFSADFAPFFMQATVDGSPLPVLAAAVGELPPVARECLMALGLTLYVDDEALVRRCAPLLLRAGSSAPPEALACVYGALGPCEGGLLEELREGICVPGHGRAAAGECVFLPVPLRGLGELVGRLDLGAHFPELDRLFVRRLGVADSVPVEACVSGLKTLRERAEGTDQDAAEVAEGVRMATCAYRRLQLAHDDPNVGTEAEEALRALEQEPLVLVPRSGTQPRPQWRHGRSCMWYDVPAGGEVQCAALEAHYPRDLKPFFVKLFGAREINANEVFERMAAVAEREDAAPHLAEAYSQIDRVRRDEALCSDEPLRLALGAGVEIPGQGSVPTEECLFLQQADQGLAQLAGQVDLAAHYPALSDFFTGYLGVRSAMPAEEALAALRRLRIAGAGGEALPGSEAETTLRLAASAYRLLLSQAVSEEEGSGLRDAFAQEPLLLAPAPGEGDGTSSAWRCASACVWHDAPAGVLVQRASLEPHYPAELMPFFTDVLGLPRVDAPELLARLGLVAGGGEDGDGGTAGLGLQSAYDAIGRIYHSGAFEKDPDALETLRSSVFVPQQGAVEAQSCVFLDEEAAGLSDLVGKVNLSWHYPSQRDFFTSVLAVPSTLSADECLAALQALQSGDEEGGDEGASEVRQLARVAYKLLSAGCSGDGEEATAVAHAVQQILVPGRGLVDKHRCVFLRERYEGLADLLDGVVDLRLHYPDLEECLVSRLGVRSCLTADECLDTLRVLRDCPAAGGAPGWGEAEEAAVNRQVFAAYDLLERSAAQTARAVDLSIVFEEESLLLFPGRAAEAGRWRRSSEAMWHDAPSGAEVRRAALEPHYPPKLGSFLVEGLGVRALDAGEAAARLDALRSKGTNLQQFAEAYAQLQRAHEARQAAGLQFWDPDLVESLSRRIFVPGAGLLPKAKCLWQSRHARLDVSKLAGRHNLLEVYEGIREQKVALLRSLKLCFVDWLGISDSLTVEESLEALRALAADESRRAGDSTALTAKALYCELARALKSCEPDDASAATKAFKKESLTYVPATDGRAGHFCTSDECVWRSPAEAPEGWEPSRAELAPHYADESSLKSLFTERLGVPMSVRFGSVGDRPQDHTVQKAPVGQPVWLMAPSEGGKMVPVKRSATPPPRPSTPPVEADNEPEAEEDLGAAEAGQTHSHLDRGYYGVDTQEEDEAKKPGKESAAGDAGSGEAEGEEGKPHGNDKEQGKDEEPEAAGGEDGRPGTGRPDKFTLPDRMKPKAPGDDSEQVAGRPQRPGIGHGDVPPPPEPHAQVRGIAADGRRERKALLQKLSRSVNASCLKQMNSQASRVKHRPEESIDCNPQHDIERWAVLQLEGRSSSSEVTIPIWIEREGKLAASRRLEAARSNGDLERFAVLLMSLADVFSIPCRDRINIFEEDTQAIAFNGGALYFNLRYFVEEKHSESWEDAVSFWTISFAHELAHFESLIHDRLHGRTMEHTQRAVIPLLPRVLNRPWGRAGDSPGLRWSLHDEQGRSQ